MPSWPQLLWLDDDTPPVSRVTHSIHVTCVQTCLQAAELLETLKPSWVIVDLVVPQGGWRANDLLRLPGLAFAEYVITKFQGTVPVVIFSAGMSEPIRASANAIGVSAIYHKMNISIDRIVKKLAAGS